MYFITVLNGVITGLHDGDPDANFFGQPFYGHERIPVQDLTGLRILDPLTYYTPEWTRKSDCCLIDEGLIPMPEGYVREGDALRPMTRAERIIAGLDELPLGYKIADGKIIPMTQAERIIAGFEELPNGYKIENGELILMTIEEQLEAGQISQEECNARIAAENEAELQRRLGELQTPEALAQAEVDEEYAAERKAKLQALLTVKKQPGWPLVAVWPGE